MLSFLSSFGLPRSVYHISDSNGHMMYPDGLHIKYMLPDSLYLK